MTDKQKEELELGAVHVDETEELSAGLEDPRTENLKGANLHESIEEGPVAVPLGEVTLTMLPAKSGGLQVRVGSPYNPAETYEGVFESAQEANTALLDAGILTGEQVPDPAKPATESLHLTGLTAEQLVSAGLNRRRSVTM